MRHLAAPTRKTFFVQVPLTGYMLLETEAFTREEAIQKFMDGDYREGEPEDPYPDTASLQPDWLGDTDPGGRFLWLHVMEEDLD